jgi:hypothetical protein
MLSVMDHGSDGCASERLLANDDGGNVDDCTAWCSARCGAASTPIARGMIKMKSVCSIGSLSMFDERVIQSLRVQAESNVSQKSNQIKDSSSSSIQTTNNVYYLSATKQSFKKNKKISNITIFSPESDTQGRYNKDQTREGRRQVRTILYLIQTLFSQAGANAIDNRPTLWPEQTESLAVRDCSCSQREHTT